MFQTGGFPDLDLSFLFCPFFSFFGLSRVFRVFPDLLGDGPGISRFVPFLFLGPLGILRAPTRNSPERVRDTIWTFPKKSGKHPGLETPRFSFSQTSLLSAGFGDLAPSLAIAIVRFWCAKFRMVRNFPVGACVCPPPRGGPWKPLLRVSVFGMLSASLRFVVAIMYGYMLWSCLVCSLSLFVLAPKRGRSGRTFSGVPVLFLNLECYCATGGGYLGGGAPAPRYQGPPERLSREAGRPMGPSTPRCSSQSCVFVCLVSCGGFWNCVWEI